MFNKESTYVAALLSAAQVGAFAEMARWRIPEVMREVGCPLGSDQFEEEAAVRGIIAEALQSGWLERLGTGTGTKLVVSEEYSRLGRRALFGLDPAEAKSAYEAGRILASRLSTSSKNWAKAESDSTVRSGKRGNRRQFVAGR